MEQVVLQVRPSVTSFVVNAPSALTTPSAINPSRASPNKALRGHATHQSQPSSEEIRVKTRVTLIPTGFKPGYWSDIFGTGIRDVLNNKDATKYEDAYRMALTLLNAGKGSNEELKAILGADLLGEEGDRHASVDLEARGLDPALAGCPEAHREEAAAEGCLTDLEDNTPWPHFSGGCGPTDLRDTTPP
ncbi:MAG: hypothetical protein MZV65_18795 [Chromatiales bacterium]|nr:hypothetical protein [Chromatiales bacterium]